MKTTLDGARSYATVARLEQALAKYGFSEDRWLLAFTSEGRATAVFPVSNIQDGNLLRYAHRGFMTLG